MRRYRRRPPERPPLPAPLSPFFRENLDALCASVVPNAGFAGSLDLLWLLDLFDRFYEAGECAHPDQVARYLSEVHGWNSLAAGRVGYTWEVVVGLRNLDMVRKQA